MEMTQITNAEKCDGFGGISVMLFLCNSRKSVALLQRLHKIIHLTILEMSVSHYMLVNFGSNISDYIDQSFIINLTINI